MDTILKLSNFEISSSRFFYAIPLKIKFITFFFNIFFRIFTFLNNFSFSQIVFLRKREKLNKKIGKFSIIIPCKNEEENISLIFKEISENIKFDCEIIFINDQSTDQTSYLIKKFMKMYNQIQATLIDGPGEGKSRAVNIGIEMSSGEYCIILDADLTVKVNDLNLFYNAVKNNLADVINGSRLVLKMEEGSMPYSNYLGNIFFSKLISWITNVEISDSLCGSKCFKKELWYKFEEYRKQNKINDLWGDFSILFGSAYYGFKLIDIPIRYFRREHGQTKMNRRIYYFFNMLGICLKNIINFKFL